MSFKKKAISTLVAMMKENKGLVAGTIRECIAAVERLPEDGWICTAEQLPDLEFVRTFERENGEYPEFLAVIREGVRACSLRYCVENVWMDDNGYHYSVTHWQPLPEIPQKVVSA